MQATHMRPILLLALTLLPTAASAQRAQPIALANPPAVARLVSVQAIAAEPCHRSAWDVSRQLVFGVAGALIGGIVPFLAIDDAQSPNRRVKGDAGYQRSANVAYALGSWAGAAAGVALTGTPGCRAPAKAVIGAAIPSLLLLAGYDDPYLPVYGVVLGAPLQSIGATIGVGVRD